MKGCKAEAERPHQRGPVVFRVCPVRFVGEDVSSLVESFLLAGERLSLTEQQDLPAPYLDALEWAASYIAMYRDQETKRINREYCRV